MSHNVYGCPHCGHICVASVQPSPIRWNDGHVCRFVRLGTVHAVHAIEIEIQSDRETLSKRAERAARN